MLIALVAGALVAWLAVLCLPSRPYSTRERFEPAASPGAELGAVTVLIPARNEEATLGCVLDALACQGAGLEVVVVDDQSTDSTSALCRERAAQLASAGAGRFPLSIRVVEGAELPTGWGGKLWALQQGLAAVERPYTVLLDADIELAPGVLAGLLDLSRRRDAALVSVMATLNCESAWERLLVPAFVFFFKLLYPFSRVNERGSSTAAAAGGCILARSAVLREAGAFAAIRSALIDDCSLAGLIKRRGHALWLGLSHSVLSLRSYRNLADFWAMVSRTAFTQLGYSAPLLLLTAVVMVVLFVMPLVGLVTSSPLLAAGSALALAAMAGAYAPVVRFYKLSPAWALTLPFAAVLLLAMTIDSAANYWRGMRAEWKDRAYEVGNE